MTDEQDKNFCEWDVQYSHLNYLYYCYFTIWTTSSETSQYQYTTLCVMVVAAVIQLSKKGIRIWAGLTLSLWLPLAPRRWERRRWDIAVHATLQSPGTRRTLHFATGCVVRGETGKETAPDWLCCFSCLRWDQWWCTEINPDAASIEWGRFIFLWSLA